MTPDEPPTPDAPARRHAPFAADGDLDRPLVDPLTRTEIPAPDTEPERFAAGGTMPEIDDTTLPSSNAAAEHGSIDEAVGADHTGTADLTGNDPVGTPPSDAAKPVTSPDTPAVVEPAIEAQPTPNGPAATTESSSSDATDRPAETSGAGGGDRSLGELAEGELEEFEDHPSGFRILVEWIAVFAGAFLVALILRAFVVQSFFIPSESMESTLTENDRVLVNKLSYRLGDVNRGDVIVFRRDPNTPGDTDDLIKRVIGLPGESVEIRAGAVYINGQLLDEPYLDADVVLDDFPATDVPEDEFFVMGDNRDQSFDSRWIGPVPRERIVGRAFVLFWPLNRADAL